MMKNLRCISNRGWHFGLVFFGITLMASCQEVEIPEGKLRCQVEAVAGEEDDVVGKWKLVQERRFKMINGEIQLIDYSCNNIIYRFNLTGILEITNDVGRDGHVPGEYVFELISPSLGEINYHILKIGTLSWPCMIEKRNMTLNLAHVDGPTLYFVRIE